MSTDSSDILFLFDVDNTLLDNDAVQEDLSAHLQRQFGQAARERYWAIFETLRSELGYADYLGALQRYRAENPDDMNLLGMSAFLIDYPFSDRLFPGALEVLRHCERIGPTAILSDGDVVFQPHKVIRSGLWDAVHGRVMIYLHKEQMLQSIERHYPARHYVMVDDKLRILAAMKQLWKARLTTVFVRQGHYALDLANISTYPPANLTIEKIADLRGIDSSHLRKVS